MPRARWGLALLALAAAGGCKKEEKKPIDLGSAPPTGAANSEALTLGIGVARALDPELAPTSTEWRHTYVVGKDHAVVVGFANNEAVAIVTQDGGKTWRTFRSQVEDWSAWGISKEGNAALVGATKLKPPEPKTPPKPPPPGTPPPPPPRPTHALFDGGRFSIAASDAQTFPALGTLIDPLPKPKGSKPCQPNDPTCLRDGARIPLDAVPIPLNRDRAAIVFEEGPKNVGGLFHVTRTGVEGTALRFGAAERVIPTPYAKPPSLLSYTGKALYRRPVPDVGIALPLPSMVVGVDMTPRLAAELSAPHACESGDLTFQRVTLPGERPGVLVVGPERIFAVALPPGAGGALGCSATQVLTEVTDDKGIPNVAVCPLEVQAGAKPAPAPSASAVAPPAAPPPPRAKKVEAPWIIERSPTCTLAQKPPFRLWNDKHDRRMLVVPTDQGVIAFLQAWAGERWGLTLAYSIEKGTIYEVSRAVAEGSGERGKVELAAVIPLGKRTILLFTSDIMGTSRRGLYVIASDDGGNNWQAP